MRKIASKEDEGKRKRRNQFIVGGVLIFLMFFSTLGYAFQLITHSGGEVNSDGQSQTINYNNFEFTEQNGFWVLSKDGSTFIFKNNPYEVPRIESEIKLLEHYLDKPLYIMSESIEAESEIRTNLAKFVDSIKNACLEGELCEEINLTATCNDNFISIKSGNTNKIEQRENCVFIEGNVNSLTALVDEFLFKLLEVDN